MNEKLTTFIAKDEAMVTANWIISKVNNEPSIKTIELKARGFRTYKAIDVLEILKRWLKLKKTSIKTHTANLINRNNKEERVSVITIKLERK